jgi:hypothetical protein
MEEGGEHRGILIRAGARRLRVARPHLFSQL